VLAAERDRIPADFLLQILTAGARFFQFSIQFARSSLFSLTS
jgi:hypothetical protein